MTVTFWWAVRVDIELGRDDVEHLLAQAGAHYDQACRDLALPGGMLYGWRNVFLLAGLDIVVERAVDGGARAKWTLEADDVDLLCKVLEGPPRVASSKPRHVYLCTLFRETLQRMNETPRLPRGEPP